VTFQRNATGKRKFSTGLDNRLTAYFAKKKQGKKEKVTSGSAAKKKKWSICRIRLKKATDY
jgi:hypothetical protein